MAEKLRREGHVVPKAERVLLLHVPTAPATSTRMEPNEFCASGPPLIARVTSHDARELVSLVRPLARLHKLATGRSEVDFVVVEHRAGAAPDQRLGITPRGQPSSHSIA